MIAHLVKGIMYLPPILTLRKTNGVESIFKFWNAGELLRSKLNLKIHVSILEVPSAEIGPSVLGTYKSCLPIFLQIFFKVNRVNEYAWVNGPDHCLELQHAWG